MLYKNSLIFTLAWVFFSLSGYSLGGFINVLPALAIIIVLMRFVLGRPL